MRGETVVVACVLALLFGLSFALMCEARRGGRNVYSEGLVIGVVVGVEPATDPKRPDVLVVEDRSRPEWPQKVACEFFHKQKNLIANVRNGDLVRVVGGIKSSESRNGGYFTHFVGFALQPLSNYSTQQGAVTNPQHSERRGSDVVPF